VVVGGETERMRHPDEIMAVKHLAGDATRVVAVCTGAFLLAEAGLLDGRRATTHWACARDLQQGYPAVNVEPDRIFVADGPVWTSAGITAGIDLALALIEADYGIHLARAVARKLVVYHRRPGGQSQFSALSLMEPESDRMRIALAFAREHLSEQLPLDRLAEVARLSPRQFGRAFRHETGETPAKAVERLRVEAARLGVWGARERKTYVRADPVALLRGGIGLCRSPPLCRLVAMMRPGQADPPFCAPVP